MARLLRKKKVTAESDSLGKLNVAIISINMLQGTLTQQDTVVDVIKVTSKMFFTGKTSAYYVPGKVAKTSLDTVSRRTELLGNGINLYYRCISKGDAKKLVREQVVKYLERVLPNLNKIKI